MALKIKGMTVELAVKRQTGTDGLNRPVYETEWTTVENVLIGQPETQEVMDELNLSGKRIDYVLAVPKGDQNVWQDTQVRFFGTVFETVGMPIQGIEAMMPLEWHKKVKVMRYEVLTPDGRSRC